MVVPTFNAPKLKELLPPKPKPLLVFGIFAAALAKLNVDEAPNVGAEVAAAPNAGAEVTAAPNAGAEVAAAPNAGAVVAAGLPKIFELV